MQSRWLTCYGKYSRHISSTLIMDQTIIHKRRAARRLAMQALYAWQMTQDSAAAMVDSFKSDEEYARVDHDYFRELVIGVIDDCAELDETIGNYVSRSDEQLDQVEQAVLRMAAYELRSRHDIPFKVVVSEGVALCKKFGAQDGYKFINSVLDNMSAELRAFEKCVD